MRFVDVTGQRFGRLIVKKCYKPENKKQWYCSCLCDCGNTKNVLKDNLTQGKISSCGCLRAEEIVERSKRYCKYDFSKDYVTGYDCNNKRFYFDIDDYEKVKNISWRVHDDGSVVGYFDGKYVKFHRFVMDCLSSDCVVDHINHNRADNRKVNLRKATQSQNMRNVRVKSNNTSGFVGVCWNKNKRKWFARITVDKCEKCLGYFDNIKDAVIARKIAEEKYFKDFSYDNSIKSVADIVY